MDLPQTIFSKRTYAYPGNGNYPGRKGRGGLVDTRIGPKKYVASGAHIYGRDVISTEAFTFMHWRRYRATLEELK